MSKTITIELDENTKKFYHDVFLARKMSDWISMYTALHGLFYDDDISGLDDKEILLRLADKEKAKNFLTAAAYEDYIKYYDQVFIKKSDL